MNQRLASHPLQRVVVMVDLVASKTLFAERLTGGRLTAARAAYRSPGGISSPGGKTGGNDAGGNGGRSGYRTKFIMTPVVISPPSRSSAAFAAGTAITANPALDRNACSA